MTDNLRDRIAAVIEYHGQLGDCECDDAYPGIDWASHQADMVVEALNLRTDQVGTLTRHVTEWTTNG